MIRNGNELSGFGVSYFIFELSGYRKILLSAFSYQIEWLLSSYANYE